MQWSNVDKVSSVDDNFTMQHTLIMLFIDIILYTLITWYFDALLPGDFGTPQPFYFPFTVYFCNFVLSLLGDIQDTDPCSEIFYLILHFLQLKLNLGKVISVFITE